MPLVDAKCTNCGAVLRVDSTKDAAICEFCGSAYVVEKAINNYNVVNNNNINAEVVNIYGGNSSDFVIRAGELIAYNGASTDVVIPDGVHSILPDAIPSGITSITIPESVTYIGKAAFANCEKLSEIIIPNSVTYIGKAAFANCEKLSEIIIPNSVTDIGESAFANCKKLREIIIPNGVQEISSGMFNGCTSLKSITLPQGIKVIGNYAFERCSSLEEIIIPDSVETIGYAFCDCTSLKTIVLPNHGCTSYDSVKFGTKVVAGDSFRNCTSLKEITIQNGTEHIGCEAFFNCSSLIAVNLPNSLKHICAGAFGGCKSLKEIVIPESVSKIDNYAYGGKAMFTFTGCVCLEKITIQGDKDRFAVDTFRGSKWYDDLISSWKREKRCQHCGGEFKFWGMTCKKCGKPKDY